MNKNDNSLILELGKYISLEDTGDSFYHYIRKGFEYWIMDKVGYLNYLSNLYEQKKGEQSKISKSAFEELLINDYRDLISNPDHNHFFNDEIAIMPLITTHVLLPIYNLQLSKDSVQIGEYKVIQFQKIGEYIGENGFVVPSTEKNNFENDRYFFFVPFVDIVVEARDNKFAEELARKKLNSFISFLNYCIFSEYKGVDVASHYSNAGNQDRSYLFSETSFSSSSSKTPFGVKCPDLTELIGVILDKEKGNERLLEIIQKDTIDNQMEQRLMNALNWLGLSIAEKNNAIALTQATFAVECLLQSEVKGEPITKSIVASISEMIAFLTGSSFENRKEIEKRFKILYGIRSKVAHGKSDSVSVWDVLDIIYFAKQIITAILITPDLKEAKTIQAVNNYIEKKRYTCKED